MKDASSPKPNWIATGLCLMLIFGWISYSSHRWPAPAPRPKPPVSASAPATAVAPAAPTAAPAPAPAFSAPEVQSVLQNENLRAVFTSHGGGLLRVDLLSHSDSGRGAEPVSLNGGIDGRAPIFSLNGWDGNGTYAQTADSQSVTYSRVLPGGLRLERRYSLAPGDSYTVLLQQRITNPTAKPVTLPEYEMEVGTAVSLYGNDQPQTVSANWFGRNGESYSHLNPPAFNASNGFLGYGAHPARDVLLSRPGDYAWAAVKNRFFTIVLTPPASQTLTAVICTPVVVVPQAVIDRETAPRPVGGDAAAKSVSNYVARPASGINAAARFAGFTVAPGQTLDETYALYAGPKEHDRLDKFGGGQERLMEFGMWGWVAVPLMSVLETMHRVIPNYGWVIVLLTLALKILFWPLQSAANHSMKKMQALAPKQKELSEKYKEDPQRMQVEVMKLYKEYGVNPVGGCLPVLIQIPIFFGFYTMLQSAVQFRHQTWLWVHDLVRPDTVAVFPGLNLPINPLPIIMALSQYAVMKLTPNTGNNQQMKMMQFMPLLMLVLFYNFAAALALYWTVNNLVTVVQTYHNLRKPVQILQRLKRKPKMGIKRA